MTDLTDWETGQVFIDISDMIAEKMGEIDAERFSYLHKEMDRARARLGDALKGLKSHGFGIYDGAQFRTEYREKL